MNEDNSFKRARKMAGLSQREVADRLSISIASVSAYETGNRTPNPALLVRMATLYNTSVDELLGTQTEDEILYLSNLPEDIRKAFRDLFDSVVKQLGR